MKKANKSWAHFSYKGLQWREREEKRDSQDHTFIPPLLLSTTSKIISEQKGKPQLPLELTSKQRSQENKAEHPSPPSCSIPSELQPALRTLRPPAPRPAASRVDYTCGLKQRLHFCTQLFYSIRPNPAGRASQKAPHWHQDFADCASKLVDNYFSISVNAAGRIYRQYTACNITHTHSSSSASFLSLPFSLSFPVPWGLCWHQS